MTTPTYAWIIDKDHIDHTDGGVYGPHYISQEQLDALRSGDGRKFRMLDDDGELYYEGRIVTARDDDDLFGPLYDFGAPNAGCTEILYYQNGWKQL